MQNRRNLLQDNGDNGDNDDNKNECRPFNREIEKRVLERLGFYMGGLISTNLFISNFIANGGFTISTNGNNNVVGHADDEQQQLPLTAAHRNTYLALAYSLPQTLVYFGLEDGTCVGNYWDYGYYREPGNAGYSVNVINQNNTYDNNNANATTTTVNPAMQKHWKSCINSTTGEPMDCVLPPGDLYIQCSRHSNNTSDGDDDHDDRQQAEAASGLCHAMELCPDAASQRDCSPLLQQQQQQQQQNDTTTNNNNTADEYQACMAAKKWCRQYTIENATATTENNNNNNTTLGMIPLTNYCMDKHGQFTQALGKVFTPLRNPNAGNNCYYLNGKTLVQRHDVSGDYAYCQQQQVGSGSSSSNNNNAWCMTEEENNNATSSTLDNNTTRVVICNDTFVGGYESNNYDPRYRPWYSSTKELQMPNWSLYPFFALGLGITYSYPIYQTLYINTNHDDDDEEQEKQVFAGVLAIDYRIEDIAQFLVDSYGNTTTSVVIYEDATPNFVIGTSTGSSVVKQMLSSNLSLPCPVESFTNNVQECTPVRLSISDMSSQYMDVVQSRAFAKHQALNYPQELLSVNGPSSSSSNGRGTVAGDLFISQSTLFEQKGAHGLKWRVLITSPAKRSTSDAITVENSPSFVAAICIIAGLGFVICTLFGYIFYRKRTERAIIMADWRFTCAFILGCSLLNVATFTFLGRNTDATCLLRMWSFHVCFVMALAPLFVKVWRIRQLVGRAQIRRTTINNTRAALYTLPMIFIQLIILFVITFVDPPKPTEVIENTGSQAGVMVQSIVCDTDTNALLIVQMLFEGGLILVGCILAYRSRNMNSEFGEAKQLIFAMYNIALVGIIVILVVTIADVDPNGQRVFSALGIFWGTVFSSAAFVLPRMIQVRQARSVSRHNNSNGPKVHISGIEVSGREECGTGTGGGGDSKTTPAPTTSNRTTISPTSKIPDPCVDVTVPLSSGGNSNDQVRVVRWEADSTTDVIKEEKETVISATNMDSC